MSQNLTFPVDGQLLMVMPKAGASIRNPDIQLPVFRQDKSGYYLEIQVNANSEDEREIAVTRRVPIDNLSESEWLEVESQYKKLDFSVCKDRGINKALENIADRRIQRLFLALLTFLNPRQVAIILYLYREAAEQSNSPLISFRSNDLLGSNKSRNNKTLWRTIKQLKQEGYITEASEILGKRKMTNIQFQINPNKLCCR